MISGTTTTQAAALLAGARRAKAAEQAAAVEVLQTALAWCELHEATDLDDAATLWAGRGQDTGIPIGGDGAPLVSEFAVAEFAAALGLSAGAGRNLLGQALALAYRLPRLWARVQAGSLAPWKARRIAEDTGHLTARAAGWVDAQVAPFAHKTGPAQLQRLLDTAIARFMPDHAAEQRERAAEQRYLTVDHTQVSFAGTSRVHGELDLPDALDLEDALAAGAARLAALGSTETLEVRRALALGMLARGEQALAVSDQTPGRGFRDGRCATSSTTDQTRRDHERQVVLHVHLSAEAIRSSEPDATAWVEEAGGRLVTAADVATWCGREDTTRVIVKPVIDLHIPIATDAYAVPERIAEHVRLRDTTCVFPWCQRPARSCDLDHIEAYLDPADGGPPAQTSTSNLAPLCRLHHRMKTHAGWTYTMPEPGTFLWASPHGLTWQRDATGTTDLTPAPVTPPVDPPQRRTS